MDNQLTKRINSLNNCLVFLVENPEFWETDTHYRRQKAFTYTNNYYAHQINDTLNKLVDVYKIVINDANLNLKTIEKQYKSFSVEQSKSVCIGDSKFLLDGLKNHIKEFQDNYKIIGQILEKPNVINQHDYEKMKLSLITIIKDINETITHSTDNVLMLAVNINEIRDEVELIEMRYNSGDIQYKSGIKNFMARLVKPNKGYKP